MTDHKSANWKRLHLPAGPPANAEGNVLPLPQWLPGQPQPPARPPHIYAPHAVSTRLFSSAGGR